MMHSSGPPSAETGQDYGGDAPPSKSPPEPEPSSLAPRYAGAPLKCGDAGGDVRAVQEQLNGLGADLEVDGVYGPLTEVAVRRFQQGSDKLEVDGVVGPKTWAALWEAPDQHGNFGIIESNTSGKAEDGVHEKTRRLDGGVVGFIRPDAECAPPKSVPAPPGGAPRAAGTVVRLSGPPPAETEFRPSMAAARHDDSDRTLKELCLRWCRILWLPGPDFNAPLDDRDRWDADQIARLAVKPTRTIVKPKKTSKKEHIPQTHQLSAQAEVLRDMLPHLESRVRTGLNRVRHYAFHAVLCEIGRQPSNVLVAVGSLLYDLKYSHLEEVFGGIADQGTVDKLIREHKKNVGRVFSLGIPWDQREMREAEGAEQEHMQAVLDWLSEDLVLPHSAHTGDFCATYKEIIEAEPVKDTHRKPPPIEQKAEHLIVCTNCGGMPKLTGEVLGSEAPPNLALHVPSCFLPDERGGAK